MQAVIGGVSMGTPLLKMALRMLGLGPLLQAFPLAEAALKAATILFGVTSGSIPSVLLNMVSGYATTMAVSSLTMFVLGTGGAVGFAATALLFVAKSTAGLVYLTVDLTARGVIGAGKALWDAMPRSSPPPAHWHIQDNYKPTNRSSHLPPATQSLGTSQPVVLDHKELVKLAGDSNLASSFIECTDDQLDIILGRSQRSASKALIQPSADASPSFSTPIKPLASSTAPTYDSTLFQAHTDEQSASSGYPVATISQDAFAGYLGQSIRQIQMAKQVQATKFNTIEEVEEMLLNDPEFQTPPGAEPGHAAAKLELSVDLHASSLRKRDPIVDSWMDVSAPMMGE